MARVGILLACQHYPNVTGTWEKTDLQLRTWLASLGHEFTSANIYDCSVGHFPSECGAESSWIVGGGALLPVRRQGFGNQGRPRLRESLADLVGLIMRRAGGDASAVLRVSFV